MKVWKSIIFYVILAFFLTKSIDAASFNISSSVKQIAPNETFTINVGGDCIGRVDLKVSNGSLSTNSVWVEEGYISVKVTAGNSGSVIITATPITGFSDPDANIYNPGSRSVTVNIVAPSSSNPSTNQPPKKPNNTEPTTKKSNDNNLAALSIEEGKITPNFDKNKQEYTINLNADITSLNIKATANDSKAKIEGTGKIPVKPGLNTINIMVIAENGSKKIYTIKAYVDETPQVFFNYKDEKIGIVVNLEDIKIPDNFSKKEIIVNDKKITLFTKDNINIIYGINENNEKSFYLFNKEKNEIISKFVPLNFNNLKLYIIDSEPKRDNVTLDKVVLNNTEIECYKFNQNNNYCLLYTINNDNNIVEYLYEASENTIQLFPDFLTKKEIAKEKSNIIIYIFSFIIIILLGIILFLFTKFKKGGRNEKIN